MLSHAFSASIEMILWFLSIILYIRGFEASSKLLLHPADCSGVFTATPGVRLLVFRATVKLGTEQWGKVKIKHYRAFLLEQIFLDICKLLVNLYTF